MITLDRMVVSRALLAQALVRVGRTGEALSPVREVLAAAPDHPWLETFKPALMAMEPLRMLAWGMRSGYGTGAIQKT